MAQEYSKTMIFSWLNVVESLYNVPTPHPKKMFEFFTGFLAQEGLKRLKPSTPVFVGQMQMCRITFTDIFVFALMSEEKTYFFKMIL